MRRIERSQTNQDFLLRFRSVSRSITSLAEFDTADGGLRGGGGGGEEETGDDCGCEDEEVGSGEDGGREVGGRGGGSGATRVDGRLEAGDLVEISLKGSCPL